MPVQVCSLKVDTPQIIPADGRFHIVRFPFGTGESSDAHDMHQMVQPDGHRVADWRQDDRSGLIWPSADGWGSLTAMIYWEASDATEYRARFVRDPLGLSTGFDSTATVHQAPTPGEQRFHHCHELFAHPGTPLALMVMHNASRPVAVTLAEFKLAIHT